MIKLKQIESGAAITALLSGGGGGAVSAYKADISGANPGLVFPLDATISLEIVRSGTQFLIKIAGSVPVASFDLLMAVQGVPAYAAPFMFVGIPAGGGSVLVNQLTFTTGTFIELILHRQSGAGGPDMTWKIEVYGNDAGVANGTFVSAKVMPWV